MCLHIGIPSQRSHPPPLTFDPFIPFPPTLTIYRIRQDALRRFLVDHSGTCSSVDPSRRAVPLVDVRHIAHLLALLAVFNRDPDDLGFSFTVFLRLRWGTGYGGNKPT